MKMVKQNSITFSGKSSSQLNYIIWRKIINEIFADGRYFIHVFYYIHSIPLFTHRISSDETAIFIKVMVLQNLFNHSMIFLGLL